MLTILKRFQKQTEDPRITALRDAVAANEADEKYAHSFLDRINSKQSRYEYLKDNIGRGETRSKEAIEECVRLGGEVKFEEEALRAVHVAINTSNGPIAIERLRPALREALQAVIENLTQEGSDARAAYKKTAADIGGAEGDVENIPIVKRIDAAINDAKDKLAKLDSMSLAQLNTAANWALSE